MATIQQTAQALWPQFAGHSEIKSLLEKDGRTGVVVKAELFHRPKGERPFAVGVLADEKELKYRQFALEKYVRLYHRPEHRTSTESRNETAQLYSGAVRGTTYIVSTSGLWPDALDELFSVALLVAIDDLWLEAAVKILRRAKNPYARAISTMKLHGLVS